MAAPQGFEPRYADPESAVLPLNEGAEVCGWTGLCAAALVDSMVLTNRGQPELAERSGLRFKGAFAPSSSTVLARALPVRKRSVAQPPRFVSALCSVSRCTGRKARGTKRPPRPPDQTDDRQEGLADPLPHLQPPITLEDSFTSADEDGQAVHSASYARQIGKKKKTGTNPRPSNRWPRPRIFW